MSVTIRHLRPGDPEFEELAAQITPLHRIRKGYSQTSRNDITAATAPRPKARRQENKDALRG